MNKKIPSATTKRLFTINLVIATELNILAKKGETLSPFESKLKSTANQLIRIFKYKALTYYPTIIQGIKDEIENKSYSLDIPVRELIYGLLSLVSSHQLKLYWEILPKDLQNYSEEIDETIVAININNFITFHNNISKKYKAVNKMYSTITYMKKKKEKKERDKKKKKDKTFHAAVKARRKQKFADKHKKRKERVATTLKDIVARAKAKTNEKDSI